MASKVVILAILCALVASAAASRVFDPATIVKHTDACGDNTDCKSDEFCNADGLCSSKKAAGADCDFAAECADDFCIKWNKRRQCATGCNKNKDCPDAAPKCTRTAKSLPLGQCETCRQDADCESDKKGATVKYCLTHWTGANDNECLEFGEPCNNFMDCQLGAEICDNKVKQCRRIF